MEHRPFEDVFPLNNGDIPASYVSLPEGNTWQLGGKPGAKLLLGILGVFLKIWSLEIWTDFLEI